MGMMSTREAYGKALIHFGKGYDFFVLDADLAHATQTILFKKEFPERFFNMGIAEGDMMATAAGMATCGKKVFASTFAMFGAGRAYEQIRNSIAYTNLPVVIAVTHGGVFLGEDGASHQAIEDISLMRGIPNMTVIAPCDQVSVNQIMLQALNYQTPIYLRLGRAPTPAFYTDDVTIEIGKGNVIKDGSDVTIIAIGDMVNEAFLASEDLAKEGISTAVIDMHTIKPIDKELILKYAEKTKKIITVEDHNIVGGLGTAVAEVLAENNTGAILKRHGIYDRFGQSGSRDALQEYFGLNAKTIIECIKQM